jgi:ubiquinone/menaquinone biosynthesis C-methylase UbiE
VSRDEFSRQDIEYHRATAASYDQNVTEVFEIYHQHLLEPFLDDVAADVGKDAQALDLGCGTGVITLSLVRRGFEVVGIDHSPDMLAIAERKLADEAGGGKYRLITGDVRQVPAADAEFDLVTCQGLLHHLADIDSSLGELARVLRPGGYFYISEPCVNTTPLKRSLANAWHRLRPAPRTGAPDDPDSVEEPINADRLRSALAELGLSFEMRFLTHLAPLRAPLPDWAYLLAVRVLSFPWRRTEGDLVFVFGRKPG